MGKEDVSASHKQHCYASEAIHRCKPMPVPLCGAKSGGWKKDRHPALWRPRKGQGHRMLPKQGSPSALSVPPD